MKLCGFNSLPLGSIEVVLTNAGADLQQRLVICSCCDYLCPSMNLAECGHSFCQRCFVELFTTTEDSKAICTVCRKSVLTMEVPIQEKFVGQLQCACPSCGAILRVKELRNHYTQCVADGEHARSVKSVQLPAISKALPSPRSTLSRIDGSLDYQDVYEVINSVTVPWRQSQDSLENRLNALEERMLTLNQPKFPSYHTLRLIYANDLAGLGRVYRTPMVNLAGLGFYFAADTQAKNLYFWISSLENNHPSSDLPSAWKLTVRHGASTQGPGKTVIIRDLHVGQLAKFHSFFKDYERQDFILTVCVEQIDA